MESKTLELELTSDSLCAFNVLFIPRLRSNIVIAAVVLFAAIGATLWRTGLHPQGKPSPLGTRLPSRISDVRVTDVLLGLTEVGDSITREKLECDDVVQRRYKSPTIDFTVYVAYWAAGRRAPSFVASHTPDRCWTLAGMTCDLLRSNYRFPSPAGPTAPGEWRRFRDPWDRVHYVVFWHRVGASFYDYERRLHDRDPLIWRALRGARDFFLRREPQYFIRISSDAPLEQLFNDGTFLTVLATLPELRFGIGDEVSK